jgi:hypothetical protein
MFRTPDGEFNDLRCPMMGAAQTRFGRNFPLNEVHPDPEPRLMEPSPRKVSQQLLARTDFKPARTLNLLAAAWIQFQIHDWFNHGDNEIDQLFAIPLDLDDPWHERPMKIRRTRRDHTRTEDEDRAGLPPTHINMASHWWDASAIYGSDADTTSKLRSNEGGKLRTEDRLLPLDPTTQICIAHPGALTLHNFPNFLRRLHLPPDASGAPADVVDLAAIDVLRDRERGVPRYNRFRRMLRLKPAGSFEELTDDPEWATELRAVYGNVDRVDLLVGSLAETPPKGFGFGETAFRIFILMASRRIKSDRFFTEDYSPRLYSQIGLDWISWGGR